MDITVFSFSRNGTNQPPRPSPDVPFNPLLLLALGILVSYTSRLLILEPISKIGFWFKIPTSPKGFAGTSAAGL